MRTKIDQMARAREAWPYLVAAAKNKTTTTYSELAEQIGVHHRSMGFILMAIAFAMNQLGYPPITGIVVNKRTGLPGHGFLSARSGAAWKRQCSKVYAYPWSRRVPY